MTQNHSDQQNEPVTYAIRYYERARRDKDAVVVWLAENLSETFVRSWHSGILKAVASLSQLPERYAIVPEEVFRVPTRHLTWTRPKSRIAHRIVYRVFHDGADGPTVMILHIRGATQPPITADEAREIEGQQ